MNVVSDPWLMVVGFKSIERDNEQTQYHGESRR